MKIVHVLSSLNIGGAERFVLDLGKLQLKSGHDVQVITFGNEADSLVSLCKEMGLGYDNLTGNVLSRNLQFRKLITGVDVVHLHTPHALRALMPSLWFTIDRKVIYTRHGEMTMSSKLWKRCHAISKYFVDQVTFVSKEAMDIFLKEQKWLYIPHQVIENGFDYGSINREKSISPLLRLGSIGRMVELKGQKYLIEAVNALPPSYKNKVSIEFFGDGVERRSLEQLASEQTDVNINFHGVVTDRDHIYNNIDLMVITSETEGLSLAMIEAMSYQNPVLATKVGGNPRLAISGVTGDLFNYADVCALTKLIMKYIDRPKLINQYGSGAEQLIKDNFSLDNTLLSYASVYNS